MSDLWHLLKAIGLCILSVPATMAVGAILGGFAAMFAVAFRSAWRGIYGEKKEKEG